MNDATSTINERLVHAVTAAYPDDVRIDELYTIALGRGDIHLTARRRQQTLGKYITQVNARFREGGDTRRVIPGINRASYRLQK